MASKRKYHAFTRHEVAQFLPDCYSRVLEIGCGEGYFAANLDKPCEYWGIEPTPDAAGKASLRLHTVYTGKYEDVSDRLPDNYFDLVVCNDVIEHMEDHDGFLDSIKMKMTENAYLVGSIPNIRYFSQLYELLFKKDWRYRDAGILDRTHMRFFTEKSFKRCLKEHGYAVEDFRGINSGIGKTRSLRRLLRNMLIRLIQFGTLGFYYDMAFAQFGFRVQRRNASQGIHLVR